MIAHRRRRMAQRAGAGEDRRLAEPGRMRGGSASLPRAAGATTPPAGPAIRSRAAAAHPPGPAVVAGRTSALLFAAVRSPLRFALKGVI